MGNRVFTFRLEEELGSYYQDLARNLSYHNHEDISFSDLVKLGLFLVKPYPSGCIRDYTWASGLING